MYIWYKNSFLASVVGIGSSILAMVGIAMLLNGEPVAGIICILAGGGGIFLSSVISAHKREKTERKAAQKAAEGASAAAPAHTPPV